MLLRGCSQKPHLGDVNLADHVLSRLYVFTGLSDEDAFTLAPGIWLTDVSLVFFGSDVGLEVTVAVKPDRTIRDTFEVCFYAA